MSEPLEKRARVCWKFKENIGFKWTTRGEWVDQSTAEASVEEENARYPHIIHWVEYEPTRVGE